MITFEIMLVLLITVVLFVSEWLRVDVIAILIMLTLAWLRLVTPVQAFSGFASNAVISIIAVMIVGYGVDRSGVMQRLTKPIVKLAGTSQSRLTLVVSATVGLISAFMQNIGAAALFLPALLRISRNTRIPASRLLMPMAFAAIFGGTLTMVASGPLIVLNDLLKQSGLHPFGLFGVTPIGLALLVAGLVYFTVFGKTILPARSAGEESETGSQQDLIESWQLPTQIYECVISAESGLIGKTLEETGLWKEYHLNILALSEGDEIFYAPWRYTRFAAYQHLALTGQQNDIERFMADYTLIREQTKQFEQIKSSEQAGFAELIIPPRAPIIGKTLREVALRKTYVVEPIMLLSGRSQMKEDFSDEIFDAGDAMIVYGRWENIKSLDDRKDFVLVTPVESKISGRARPATSLLCFLGAITLVIVGMPLPVSLLTGAFDSA